MRRKGKRKREEMMEERKEGDQEGRVGVKEKGKKEKRRKKI